MLAFAGGVLLVLGLASGLFLMLAPFGVGPAAPGWTAWILFPGLTLVGYVLFAIASRIAVTRVLSRIAGACLLAMALAAATGLFAVGNALAAPANDPVALWYVFGVGVVLGAAGFGIGHTSIEPNRA